MSRMLLVIAAVMLLATLLAAERLEGATPAAAENAAPAAGSLAQGRKLMRISGCNDCHTPGYPESGGTLPEAEWLKGSPVGWNGPWGTTYAINLRLFMQTLSEDEWVQFARTRQSRPPMPSFMFASLTEAELRSIHRYIRSLGPAGEPMPAYLPPGVEPPAPHFRLVLPTVESPNKP